LIYGYLGGAEEDKAVEVGAVLAERRQQHARALVHLQNRLQVTSPSEQVTSPSEGRCKATWKREFKLPWRKAGLIKSSRARQI